MTPTEARCLVYEVCHKTPDLPGNRGSRLMGSPSNILFDGKPTTNYVINIFDRSSPWVMPRYQKSWVGRLDEIVPQAVAWVEAKLPDLEAMDSQVAHAMIAVEPFRAEVPTVGALRSQAA